jgi:hypothetical protein
MEAVRLSADQTTLQHRGNRVNVIPVEGSNHFTAENVLADPASEVVVVIRRQMVLD